MLNEQTYQKLITMQLRGLAAAYEEYLNVKQQDELCFQERFGLMVDREYNERQQRRLQRRISDAKLREQACIEDINYRHPRGLDRSVMQRLSSCNWISNHENLLLSGPTGIGKTWIACALANKACRDNFTAFYVRLPRLLHGLMIARGDGSYGAQLARLAKTDLLVLDEWGLAPLGDAERRDILEILDDRYQRRSTIVISQLPVKSWHDYIADPTIADSILDRLTHNAHRIELKGPSLRGNRCEKSEEK